MILKGKYREQKKEYMQVEFPSKRMRRGEGGGETVLTRLVSKKKANKPAQQFTVPGKHHPKKSPVKTTTVFVIGCGPPELLMQPVLGDWEAWRKRTKGSLKGGGERIRQRAWGASVRRMPPTLKKKIGKGDGSKGGGTLQEGSVQRSFTVLRGG